MRGSPVSRSGTPCHDLGMDPKASTIDEYLAAITGDRRAALDALRKTITSIIPEAEECISYAMPAFKLNGEVVAGFLATSKGCSYYPFSGTTLRTLAVDLADFSQTKGALHFDAKKPLPRALVRKLIAARIAETDTVELAVEARGSSKRKKS